MFNIIKTLPNFIKSKEIRNKEIYQKKMEGVSYNKLSRDYDLSPQRIWQLIQREKKSSF